MVASCVVNDVDSTDGSVHVNANDAVNTAANAQMNNSFDILVKVLFSFLSFAREKLNSLFRNIFKLMGIAHDTVSDVK